MNITDSGTALEQPPEPPEPAPPEFHIHEILHIKGEAFRVKSLGKRFMMLESLPASQVVEGPSAEMLKAHIFNLQHKADTLANALKELFGAMGVPPGTPYAEVLRRLREEETQEQPSNES